MRFIFFLAYRVTWQYYFLFYSFSTPAISLPTSDKDMSLAPEGALIFLKRSRHVSFHES